MKVRIAYTIDASERLRRAINHHFGRPGLASALDVRHWFTSNGDSANADLIHELQEAERPITTAQDLLDFWSADSLETLNRRVYKSTDCGASVSVQTPDGAWHHNGQDWAGIDTIVAFTLQTIVEGSDATVDSEPFVLPVLRATVDEWIQYMEAEATRLWNEANDNEEDT